MLVLTSKVVIAKSTDQNILSPAKTDAEVVWTKAGCGTLSDRPPCPDQAAGGDHQASSPQFFMVGLSHRTAPVEVRERVSVPMAELVPQARRLLEAHGLLEVVLLSTCNRFEIYAVAPAGQEPGPGLLGFFGLNAEEIENFGQFLTGERAMEHLFGVTAGLDSMVLGETEISGQVKQAYLTAQAAGLTGRITNPVFQLALRTAKAIRTHTPVGRGATSVGSVAVELADKIFDGGLAAADVLILGAGQMGETCVRHLKKHGARRITVCNRSADKAIRLAAEVGGQPVPWSERWDAIASHDIIVGAAAADGYLIEAPAFAARRGKRAGRPCFLIDIAVPRIFAPRLVELEGVFLYDIDDLRRVVEEHKDQRRQALPQARALIAEAVAEGRRRLAPRPRGAARPALRPRPMTDDFDGGRRGWRPSSVTLRTLPAGVS
ncbi:MAG: glutamyl-tRNA reductase [Verrucomicrobia bacterium]|nr:MAG: glutamyl-tRNA reductase [Verrucomicrobiota bacterium]